LDLQAISGSAEHALDRVCALGPVPKQAISQLNSGCHAKARLLTQESKSQQAQKACWPKMRSF
jgi:hypothetical protein